MARNTNGNTPEVDSNIVTPVNLAKELGIRPQMIFGWTRSGKLPVGADGTFASSMIDTSGTLLNAASRASS